MRLYTFINFYLSSIQQGIQTAHIAHKMAGNFWHHRNQMDSSQEIVAETFFEWATMHQTIVALNGGHNEALWEMWSFLQNAQGDFSFPAPIGCFMEDDASLGGIMTGCGIVLPECVYAAVPWRQARDLCSGHPQGTACGGLIIPQKLFHSLR